jgi:hypothetical protein
MGLEQHPQPAPHDSVIVRENDADPQHGGGTSSARRSLRHGTVTIHLWPCAKPQ